MTAAAETPDAPQTAGPTGAGAGDDVPDYDATSAQFGDEDSGGLAVPPPETQPEEPRGSAYPTDRGAGDLAGHATAELGGADEWDAAEELTGGPDVTTT